MMRAKSSEKVLESTRRDPSNEAPAQAARRRELLRVLGLGFGIAVVVGGAVGQGIMRSPGIVAGAIPTPSLILLFWALGGLFVMIDAFAVAELGASLPRVGGPYAFAARAFGPFAGTMVGWVDWINGVITIGFMAVVFAEYMHRLGVLSALPLGAIAVALIGCIWVINWSSTRTSGASQGIGTALKGIGLLALVGLLFAAPTGSAPAEAAALSTLSIAAAAVALRAILNTYAGWHVGVYFCEEMHAPERNIVRSLFGGIALIALLYVLTNAAMLHVLTPEQMAHSTLPAADAAVAAFGSHAGLVITGLAIVSVVAVANLTLMYVSRIAFAMARDRALPAVFASVSEGGAPRTSVLLTALVAAACAATGGYERLIAIAVPVSGCVYLAMDISAIRMRYREPALPRPYRMPLFPLPAVLGFVINAALLAMLLYEDVWNSSLGLGAVALIGLLYKARSMFAAHGNRSE